MSSVVEIYNIALASLGVTQQVSSATEASTEAAACTLFYVTCRDRVLRDFDWSFARRYFTLGLVASDPNTDWAYAYRYPSDALSIRGIVSTTRTTPSRTPYTLGSDSSGKLIYTDNAEAVARMTVRITDTELFDALFVSALAGLLGSKIAPSLARGPKLAAAAYEMYLVDLAAAQAAAGNEEGQDPAPDAGSIQARL